MRVTNYDLVSEISEEDFFYCYSIQGTSGEKLYPENGYICNFTEKTGDVDAFIGLMLKKKLHRGAEMATECFFEGSGAPMIVLTDAYSERNGINVFDKRIEAVVYKNGVNVWHVLNDEENGKHKSTKLAALQFPIGDDEIVSLSVKTMPGGDKLVVTANGHTLEVSGTGLSENFNAGIMACEGRCAFRTLSVKE